MDVVDLKNKRFSKLTVLEYIGKTGWYKCSKYGSTKGYHTWKCLCECGNEVNVRSVKLRSGSTKSCGCLREYNKPTWTLPKGEAAKNLLYHFYKQSALKRNISIKISRDDFIEIAIKDCYYCGDGPNKSVAMRHKGLSKTRSLNGDLLYTGVDRLDNNIGYEKDNCVPCCWVCNELKKAKTLDSFINHILKIANKWKKYE